MVSFVLFPFRCWRLSRAVAGVQVRALVFLSLGWVRKTAPNPGRSKRAGLGRRRCLLACLLAWLSGCSAVGAGGLKGTTSLRNGKGRRLLRAESVKNNEDAVIRSFIHSFHAFTHSPKGPLKHPLTYLEGRYLRHEADGRCGAVDGAAQWLWHRWGQAKHSQRERSEAENGKVAASLRRPPSAKTPLVIGSLRLALSLPPLTSALH